MKNKQSVVYLENLGIACSLGLGKTAVAHALFDPSFPTQTSTETLLSGRTTSVHPVSFDVPALPSKFKSLNSRNNSLLKLALDEIAENVDNAIKVYGPSRIGIVLATSTSGMHEGETAFAQKETTGHWPDEYHYEQQETASPSIFASLYLGIQGPSYTISTACSAGSKALCSARRLIQAGICDAVIAGGVDTLCNLTLNGFDSLELLSEKICNPFSKNRTGITLGEGAAVFLVTRDDSFNDFPIEFLGSGESSDAYHISSPDPDGEGAERAIRDALKDASVDPEDICYVNLHGTATQLNDEMESKCAFRIFGSDVPCSSTKALTGHTLGAAGAIEAGFMWIALSHERGETIPLPPHVWDKEADLTLPFLRFTKEGERASPIQGRFTMISNSFAFGGSNASIIFSRKVRK
jgi:3-oxoacyl-[acyl-carrier-protein] synthase I